MSKAVEFEKEKNLPKFSHVPMAVINPIPKKKKQMEPAHDPSSDMLLASKKTKLNVRGVSQRPPLPDHLIRPPIDVLLEPIPRAKAYVASPERDKDMSNIDKKKAREEERRKEEERKKVIMCKELEQEFYHDLKSYIETSKSQNAIKNFAKLIVGKEPEDQSKKSKQVGFKYAYAEIIRVNQIPEKCSKTNFIKIVKDMKGGRHCSHVHND
jgi:hypothetical protein